MLLLSYNPSIFFETFRMTPRNFAAALAAAALLAMGAPHASSLFDLFRTQHHQKYARHASGRGHPGQEAALALYSERQRQPSFEGCADQFPAGRPLRLSLVPAALAPLALCSDNFAVLYSQVSKTPLVVVERLTSAQVAEAKGEARTNEFYPDPRLPAGARAELSDFRAQQPAVDRGHQAPAGDAPTPHAMAQSFALSNMVPQDPANNRRTWNKAESDVRKFALRARGNVYVFTGPIFDDGHAVIGHNRVWVPTRLFKLVYDESSRRAWAYVVPNAQVRLGPPVDYRAFVRITGLDLLGNLPVSGSVDRS